MTTKKEKTKTTTTTGLEKRLRALAEKAVLLNQEKVKFELEFKEPEEAEQSVEMTMYIGEGTEFEVYGNTIHECINFLNEEVIFSHESKMVDLEDEINSLRKLIELKV